MKKIIIICLTINILIYGVFTYFIFFKQNEIIVLEMKDITNLKKSEVIEELFDYDIEFIYCESTKQKDTVVYTEPNAKEFIQEGQIIKVYISTGYIKEYYKDIVNKYLENELDYIEYLEDKNIEVIIEKQISNDYPDGVIIYQSLFGEVKENESFKIIVNYNEPLILVEDFTNKTEEYVKEYFAKTNIEVYFIYNKKDGSNLVYGQSISPNSLIKNDITILYVYISI